MLNTSTGRSSAPFVSSKLTIIDMDTITTNKPTDQGQGKEKEDHEKIEKVATEGANNMYSSEPSTSQHSQDLGEIEEVTADKSDEKNANAMEADGGELSGLDEYFMPSDDDDDDDDDEPMETTDYIHDVDIDEGDEIVETSPGEVFDPEKEQHMHHEENESDEYASDEESEQGDQQKDLASNNDDFEKDDDEQSSDEELDERAPNDVLKTNRDKKDSDDEFRRERRHEIVALSDDELDTEEEPTGEEQPEILELNEDSRVDSEEEPEEIEKSGESEMEDDEYTPDEQPEEVDMSDAEEIDNNEEAEEVQESQNAAVDDETVNNHNEEAEEVQESQDAAVNDETMNNHNEETEDEESDDGEPTSVAHDYEPSVTVNDTGVRTAILRYDCGGSVIKTRHPATLKPRIGFKCRHQNCHLVLETFGGMRKHEKTHRHWPCRQCNEPSLDKENGLTHRWAHKRIYRCPFCHFESQQGRRFRLHVSNHQLTTHKCKFCLMVFAFKTELKEHMDVHEWKEDKCDLCYKRVDAYSKLKHMTIEHNLAQHTETFKKLFKNYKRAIYDRKPDPKK